MRKWQRLLSRISLSLPKVNLTKWARFIRDLVVGFSTEALQHLEQLVWVSCCWLARQCMDLVLHTLGQWILRHTKRVKIRRRIRVWLKTPLWKKRRALRRKT